MIKFLMFCFHNFGYKDLFTHFSRYVFTLKRWLMLFLVLFSVTINAANNDEDHEGYHAEKNRPIAVGILKIAIDAKQNKSVYFYSDSPTLNAGSVLFHLNANHRNENDFTLTSVTLTEDLIGEKRPLDSENPVNMSTFDEVSYNSIYDKYAQGKEFVLYRYELSNLIFYPEEVGTLAWVIPVKTTYLDALNSFNIVNNTEVNFDDGTRYTLCSTSEALLTQLFRGNTLIKDFYDYLNMDIEGNCALEDNPKVHYQ